MRAQASPACYSGIRTTTGQIVAADPMKTLVIAPSARASPGAPDNWQDQVLSTPGVELVGRTKGILQVQANEEARSRLAARFGPMLNIEDAAPRGFAT